MAIMQASCCLCVEEGCDCWAAFGLLFLAVPTFWHDATLSLAYALLTTQHTCLSKTWHMHDQLLCVVHLSLWQHNFDTYRDMYIEKYCIHMA